MTLGVISDTHAGSVAELPAPVREALAGVDLIVHAGDFTRRAVLDGLRAIGEVQAVCGNMDDTGLRAALPEQTVFEAAGRRIGLVHGFGAPDGLAQRVRTLFADVDIIIFGHSHQPCNLSLDRVLMFNPGSARDSFGLLTLGKEITARILPSSG